MSDQPIAAYGAHWAPYYDDIFSKATFEAGFLAPLAGEPARALELGVGSGRVALALAEAGVSVTGIDASDDMISLLRAKPGGDEITVVRGDFADVDVDAPFPLIYLPFNTLFALTSQERQIECFENVATALEPGGRFVLDTFVPDLTRWDHHNTRMGVSSISSDTAHAYEMSIHDPVSQIITSHHIRTLEDGSTVTLPIEIRYAWPSEMDVMARLAGLELEERWTWYDRSVFNAQSGTHVSVYRRPST